ncbi:MAG: AMP-binding protein, partial [Alphaproteobacteria bacterium]
MGRDKDAWPAARSGAVAAADSSAREGTLQALVEALAARGERPAILAMDGSGVSTWSYARLADTVLRVAAGLMAKGVIPGEPVALLGPNRPEWLVARLALLAVGALAVSLDDQANDSELGRALKDSAARRLFTSRPYLAQLERIGARQRLELYLLDDGAPEAAGAVSWRDLLAAKALPLPALRPDDPMRLFYTSGTTGRPKGVPLTHRNILTVIQALVRERFLGPDDRVLVPLPYHHSYPFIVGALLP